MTNGAWSASRDADLRDAAAEMYDRVWEPLLAPVNRRLIELMKVAERGSAVQLAAGPGAAAIAAAYLLSDRGQMLGVEISPRMLEIANARVLGMNLKQIEFVQADPERPQLKADSFDGGFCGLDLAFLSHPERAVAALKETVRPGGRVAVAVPGVAGRFPVLGFLSDVLAAHLPEQRRALLLDPYALAQEGALEALLTGAGLVNVEVRTASFLTDFRSKDEYVNTVLAVAGRTAAVLAGAEPGVTEAVREALALKLDPFVQGRGFRLQNEFVYAVGTKPQA